MFEFNLKFVMISVGEHYHRASYVFNCGCRATAEAGRYIFGTFECGLHKEENS